MIILYILIGIIFLYFLFEKQGLPVFLYHEVREDSGIDPKVLEEHFKIIKKNNMKTFTAKEAYYYVKENGKLPKNSILLTFDDGYYDNYTQLYKLLKKYNLKATIFVNTAYVLEKVNRKNIEKRFGLKETVKEYLEEGKGTNLYLTWKEMEEMEKSNLVDIELHTHEHFLNFIDRNLIGIVKNEKEMGRHVSNLYNYFGEIKEGYPIFKQKGEVSRKKIIFEEEFFEKFREFYLEKLKGLNEKEQMELGNKFINNNLNEFFREETDEEFETRIKEKIIINKNLIEEKLGKKTIAFAWPWGDWSKEAREILKEEKIEMFFTCKRGTNSRRLNFDNIRRNSLRVQSVGNFKVRLFITRNFLLGKIYELISK